MHEYQRLNVFALKSISGVEDLLKKDVIETHIKRCGNIMYETERLILDGTFLSESRGRELISHLILKIILISYS